MAVLIASDLGKDMAGEPLLRGVSFKLERRDRLTLSGRNGSGKTTLLRMLAGEASVDVGELVFQKGAKVALHDQRPPRERGMTLREYVLSGAQELVRIEEELGRLEQAMADGAYDEGTLNAYAAAQERLEHAGGYRWREEALATLRGLGFADAELDRRLDTFSGGELTRGSLARALAGDPDLLLLDEPTNHLDIAALEWLEQHLASLDAAVVLVAHDRWFLEAVGTAVLELEGGRSRFFAGTWHAWRREKAARELALGRAIERQQAEIERLERFVTRFRAGTRARQAQSRSKKLEKMDRVGRDPRDAAGLAFAFKPPERSGRVVFEMEDGSLQAGEKELLDGAEIWLERGEHVSLVGPNGAGKTTLIETLAGRRPLGGGKLRQGHNVKLGFLSQHAEEIGGKGARTVLEAAQRATGLTPNKARALLGRFLFSGQEAEKPLDGLSGGERRRLSLDPRPLGREPAHPRRAHEPPRRREPGGARVRADRLRGLAAAGLPRPGAARRGRHAHRGLRGPGPALLRRWMGRVRARTGGAQGGERRSPPGSDPRGAGTRRAGARTAQGRRSLEERPPGPAGARARDRGRRGRAQGTRGRAASARGLGGPRPRRLLLRAPWRRQAGGGGALLAVGGHGHVARRRASALVSR